MGAEGGIILVKKEDVESFENFKELLPYIGYGVYQRSIGGINLYTFYYGENMDYDPFEVNPHGYQIEDNISEDQIKKFSDHLSNHQFDNWEVWT